MKRLKPHTIDTDGANDADVLIYNATTNRLEYGPQAGTGGGSGGEFVGCHLTKLANLVIDNEDPFPFGVANLDTDAYWDSGDPTKITIPAGLGGPYLVGVDVTTLGTFYGGSSNQNVQITVLRNWDGVSTQLDYYCAYERFENKDGAGAAGNSLLQLVDLDAGDVLQVAFIGGGSNLLVESNPSDGLPGGFPTDTGPGTLSPHFYVIKLAAGGAAPTTALVPLTTTIGGVPELVWDDDNNLVMTEVPL